MKKKKTVKGARKSKMDEISLSYAKKLEKANERLRLLINDVQEKDQKLLDYTENVERINDELGRVQKNLEDALIEVEAQKLVVEEDKDRLDTIIQQMGEGVLVINENNELELLNIKAKEILGFDKADKIPVGYHKFIIFQLWKELHGSKSNIVLKEIRLQRPKEAILLVTLAKLTGKKGFVAVLRDITREKEIEKMKSDFVANVSHEIRSPMAPMKDALGLVLDGTAGPLNEQQKKFLNILSSNMDRLTRLINDLLDLSKIEAGKFELKKEPADISRLIVDVCASMKTYAENKKVVLIAKPCEDIPVIEMDKDRITQVIINLVTNAVKFTPEGGNISVQCTLNTGSVEISVCDSGPGMSRDQAELLFNRFKQLASAEQTKGTGLGLAISKAIIEMHGGRIWVETKEGKGSSFKFTLPA